MAVDDLDSLDYEDGDDLEGEGGATGGGGGLKGLLSSSIVKVLLYAAAVIVVILISVITATCVTKSEDKDSRVRDDQDQMLRTKDIYATFDLKQFMINTKDTDTQHLVRVKLQLAYKRDNIKLVTELNARRAQISDIILLFFKDKSKDQMDSSDKIQRLKEELNHILAHHTGQAVERIAEDTDRDRYMTADQARAYGLLDEVLHPQDLKGVKK